jgi:photosystem II stability/assembly factor-like uncharacterized protein
MNRRFSVTAAALVALVAHIRLGVALGTNGYLWITRDGGTSWSRVTV